MGGNALRNCETRRYNAEEYFPLCTEVVCMLASLFKLCPIDVIPAYNRKESFGDMDVLIESDNLPTDWQEKLIETFKPKQWVKNGNVLSFEYKEFQIDLIVTPSEEYDTSFHYFSYNDLGNLCGRLAHMIGLKLGHDGLAYNWRVGETYHFKTLVVEKDWNKILPVLGLDPKRYHQGFDKLEDIFEYVVSSPFFNKDIFLLHNRNHTSRVRDRKRKTYMEFLQWIEGYEETCEQRIKASWHRAHYEETGNKTHWLPYLFQQLPRFEPLYNEVQAEWEMEEEFRRRYNGDLVREWLKLDGKELGLFMKYMKEQGGERLKVDIVKMNPTIVERYVRYFYDKYTGNLPVINFTEEDMKPHRIKGS